jgi:geranyl-CoA carboxylase beta subunit
MPRFVSKVVRTSESFRANRAEMLALTAKLTDLNERTVRESEKRKPNFDKRGQLTPRERISRLLDPGMPFLEIGNMAGYLTDSPNPDKSVPGGSLIAGIGFVEGARVVIVADDSGINAGAMTQEGGLRLRRCQEIALRQKLPFIHLVESAGANLMKYTVEMFVQGGAVFANLARLSAAGLPVIAVLHGASTAGGAYMPGMSDYVVGVKGRGKAFLAGPALLMAATGEVATEEELGGAEMHANVSGLVEYLAKDDAHALLLAREIMARLKWNQNTAVRSAGSFSEPHYAPDEIAGIVPLDYRKPYDVREVVARVVDGSEISDFKSGYGTSTVCLHASVYGHAFGLIGNNGPIDPDGAAKATHFMQTCDQAQIPLVFFQNTTGFLVGTQYERAGMIKHGSKMIQAVTNVRVPRFTFMIGASFGAGNYGMSGRGYDPDFLFSWPNSKMAVMGGAQAARTMSQVMTTGARRRGNKIDEAQLKAQEAMLIDLFDGQSDSFYTSGRMLDDGLIDPRDTRKVLGFLLDTCCESRHRKLAPNSFGVGRM